MKGAPYEQDGGQNGGNCLAMSPASPMGLRGRGRAEPLRCGGALHLQGEKYLALMGIRWSIWTEFAPRVVGNRERIPNGLFLRCSLRVQRGWPPHSYSLGLDCPVFGHGSDRIGPAGRGAN